MAPKKSFASKPKRKIPVDSSSYDDHTYGSRALLFVSDEARKVHQEFYANREVLTGRKVVFNSLGENIGPLFDAQSLIPMLASICDTKYYPHLVSQFYANLRISHDTFESYLLGVDMPFDEVLIGQLLKIPSTGINLTLSVEELGWSCLEINKVISLNKKSTFLPNKINRLTNNLE